MSAQVRKAVFPLGGAGMRFRPATRAMPKEMLPVVDKPLIQYAVEEAAAAGVEQFIFVTGPGKGAIEDHFDPRHADAMPLPAGAIACTQQDKPLGLGHAVWCARHLVGDEPFAVLLPDDLILAETGCLKQMLDRHADLDGAANLIAVMEVPAEQTDRYGILAPGAVNGDLTEIRGLVEKPAPVAAPSRLAVIGRYILQPEIFGRLARQEPGAGGEIQLTDALAGMIDAQPFFGFNFRGTRFDCGDKLGFLQANIAFALARDDLGDGLESWLRAQVGNR